MKYDEAQRLSPCGVAVLGNIAMKDIVWPKDEPYPYWWITNGYKPCTPQDRFAETDKWEPLEEVGWTMKLYTEKTNEK